MHFSCFSDFEIALNEINTLVQTASSFVSESNKYRIFNKSSVVMLMAKFENFLEQAAEEYLESINSLDLEADKIPEVLKISHTVKFIESSKELFKHNHKRESDTQLVRSFSKLWSSSEKNQLLSIDSKFNYGRHGDVQLENLLNKIGITEIFNTVKITETSENMLGSTTVQIDLKSNIQKMTSYRNDIIHKDANINLSHLEIKKQIDYFSQFAKQLTEIMRNSIGSLAS